MTESKVRVTHNRGPQAPAEQDRGQSVRDAALAENSLKPVKELPEGHIEFELPNGTHLVMGPPKHGVMVLVSTILSDQASNPMLFSLVKAMMYLKSIDGETIHAPQNMVDIQAICNRLGPSGEDAVIMGYSAYWPPIGPDALRVIKKNL